MKERTSNLEHKMGAFSFITLPVFSLTISFMFITGCAMMSGPTVHTKYVSPSVTVQIPKSIVILPRFPDDQQDTYYATNYLFNEIISRNMETRTYHIDTIRQWDRGGLAFALMTLVYKQSDNFDSILTTKARSKDSIGTFLSGLDSVLSNNPLGQVLRYPNVDAILFGEGNCEKGEISAPRAGDPETWSFCTLSYYLVSTSDGRILWHVKAEDAKKASVISEHKIGYGWVSQQTRATPYYYVMTAIIDEMMKTFPIQSATATNSNKNVK